MWKCSNVTPVYKGGNVDDPDNYRLISVVSVAAKVLEKLLATQFHNYLKKHKLFHPHLGAYCHGRSSDDIIFIIISSFKGLTGDVCCAVSF